MLPLPMLMAAVLALKAIDAAAYVHFRSPQNGTFMQWAAGSNVVFRANTANKNGLSAQSLFSIFSTGIQRWIQASQGGLAFTYYQGTDTSRYPNRLGAPQDNSIFFTSQDPAEPLPCSIIGLTELWYNPSNAQILRTDMRLNDTCFQLTTDPSDTQNGSNIFYLGDIFTHETGHALGLDHSQNAQSTMFYTASKEMFKPSCDDHAAISAQYSASGRSRTGQITGRIILNGSAVFGAVVNAINLDRGINIANTLTEKDGTYRIEGLEPGVYGIMAEPYFPGSSALNSYYSNIPTALCSGANYQRTFAISEDGSLEKVTVTPGGNTNFETLALSCYPPSTPFFSAEEHLNTAPSLKIDENGVAAAASAFSGAYDHYYRLSAKAGPLTASALSYTLFSRADVQIEFLNSNGSILSGQSISKDVFSSYFSGYTNFDAKTYVTLANAQDVYVHVFTRSMLSSSLYPGASQGISGTPYYAVSVSNGPSGAPVYASNARCEQSDGFSTYSQPGEPPEYQSFSSNSNGNSAPGCGTIYDDGSPKEGPGGSFRLLNFAALSLLLFGIWKKMRTKMQGAHFF